MWERMIKKNKESKLSKTFVFQKMILVAFQNNFEIESFRTNFKHRQRKVITACKISCFEVLQTYPPKIPEKSSMFAWALIAFPAFIFPSCACACPACQKDSGLTISNFSSVNCSSKFPIRTEKAQSTGFHNTYGSLELDVGREASE